MKDEEVDDGVPIETILTGDLEGTIDAEIARITSEKCRVDFS
jgi:hypothetical protein